MNARAYVTFISIIAVFANPYGAWPTWPSTQIISKRKFIENTPTLLIPTPSKPEDFADFIKEAAIWIDKSLLLKAIYDDTETGGDGIDNDVIIATSPAGWGKTINLNMFVWYSELHTDQNGNELERKNSPAYQYFVNGKIITKDGTMLQEIDKKPLISTFEGNRHHLASYPVIRMTGIHLNMETGLVSFRSLINDAYRKQDRLYGRLVHDANDSSEHNATATSASENLAKFLQFYRPKCIENLEQDVLRHGIKVLCEILAETYRRKVVIAYDEYDHHVRKAFFSGKAFQSSTNTEQFENFLATFMAATFETNEYLRKAVITGVLNVHEASYLVGAFNGAKTFPFYGVSEWELAKLLELQKHFDQPSSTAGNSKFMAASSAIRYDDVGYRTLANLSAAMFAADSVANYTRSLSHADLVSRRRVDSAIRSLWSLFKQRAFQTEILQLIRSFGKPFVHISYTVFDNLTVNDCRTINDLTQNNKVYDPRHHRDPLFSYLLQTGTLLTLSKEQAELSATSAATVAKGRSTSSAVTVTIPNIEVIDLLKTRLIQARGLDIGAMWNGKSAILQYVNSDHDSRTLASVAQALAEYLIWRRRNKTVLTDDNDDNEDNHHHHETHHARSSNIQHDQRVELFYYFLNAFSRVMSWPLDQEFNSDDNVTRRSGSFGFGFEINGPALDVFIQEHRAALIVDYEYQNATNEHINSLFQRVLSYAFTYGAYDRSTRQKYVKFLAINVYDSLLVECKGITMLSEQLSRIFSDWQKRCRIPNPGHDPNIATTNYASWKYHIYNAIDRKTIAHSLYSTKKRRFLAYRYYDD